MWRFLRKKRHIATSCVVVAGSNTVRRGVYNASRFMYLEASFTLSAGSILVFTIFVVVDTSAQVFRITGASALLESMERHVRTAVR